MKGTFASTLTAVVVLLLSFSALAPAQNSPASSSTEPNSGAMKPGRRGLIIPGSGQSTASDIGVNARTNFEVFVPENWQPDEAPPFYGYGYETPASLACIYQLVASEPGCNPNTVTADPTGGSKSIAIVDAYDDPAAAFDLAYFSAQFGLPFSTQQFTVVYATGFRPPEDPTGDWELEVALDIEYAHAMAPKAHIYLVEAASNSDKDLLQGVSVASNEVVCGQAQCSKGGNGAGEVSMSWGGAEFSGETALDGYFLAKGVVYLAAAGDSPGTEWPSVSPNVVAAGGTTTARSPVTGDFLNEITFGSAGGGTSLYETRPSYQNSIASLVGSQRGVPDLSFDSNPITGAWVWDSINYEDEGSGWFIVGGTSLATQALTGIINSAGKFSASTAAELTTVYSNRANSADFRDITYGACGPYSGFFATPGWDFCSGVGTDVGLAGK